MSKKDFIEIIYEDDSQIIINKPSGLSVTNDRAGGENVLHVLTDILDPKTTSKLLLVHRLDKETSGVMVIAKNKDAQRLLCGYFVKSSVRKIYLAICAGGISENSGVIDLPIGEDKRDARKMAIDRRRGRSAKTKWQVLADFGGAALLAVQPLMGRTHQIRVHLASQGMALMIDPLYGSDKPLMLSDFKFNYHLSKWHEEKPLIERLTLHAYQLELPALGSKPSQIFTARLDKKFAATIKMLAKHNSRGAVALCNSEAVKTILENGKLDLNFD